MRPKITSKGIEFKDVDAGRDVALLCPGQAFPVPFYRYSSPPAWSGYHSKVRLGVHIHPVSHP